MREKNKNIRLFTWLGIVCFFALGSCAMQPPHSASNHQRSPTVSSSDEGQQKLSEQGEEGLDRAADTEVESVDKKEKATEIAALYPGSNNFINRKVASKPQMFGVVKGAILLNFENTNIREVVKTILGDILGENYVIDPAVQGAVTVQTGRPLPKDVLIPTLETLLRMNNAALVRSKGMYKVVPTNQAIQGNLSPRLEEAEAAAGYSVRIVPLRYIGVTEMQKILTPFVPQTALIRVDPARNLLILAGTAQELAQWQETIDIFDVDWLKGMSVGLYRLQHTEVEMVANELNEVLGPEAATPLAGMFRFVPIERLNGILVITSQSKYLEEAKTWIERLDQDEDTESERFYVYQVQNGRAEHLAELLQNAFGQGGGSSSTPSARVAPGQQATQLFSSQRGGFGSSSRSGGFGSSSFGGGFGSSSFGSGGMGSSPRGFMASQAQASDPNTTSQESDLRASQTENKGTERKGTADEKVKALRSAFGSTGAKGGASEEPQVRIIADEANNALLIVATSPIYDKIQSVLRQLDIAPRQVLIEATIAEVRLTDNLQYGVEWFFNNKVGKVGNNNFSGTGAVNTAIPIAAAAATGGFSYALTNAGAIRALLTAAASESNLNILSSPQLLALDNQTAEIRVGDQIPILTNRTAGVGGIGIGSNVLTSSVSYKDTGVLLTVTPRVNSGGRVTLEIRQEVTDQGTAVNVGGIENFTFLQRTFESVVTVQSGQTIVLGGLIRSNNNFTDSGVPFLRNLPVIGSLFGSTINNKARTELIVLMTPRVVRDQREASLVTEEFRQKLKNASAIVENEATVEDEVDVSQKNAPGK